MVILRCGKAQPLLQQLVNGCDRLKVLAPHHMRDPLQAIINHHRDVIAGPHMPLGDHHITPQTGLCALRLEPPAKHLAALHAVFGKRTCNTTACAAIMMMSIGVCVRQGLCLCLCARAETGVDHIHLPQRLQGLGIIIEMVALNAGRIFKGKAKPAQIINDMPCPFRLAALRIGIFNPQEQASAHLTRHLFIEQRRIGMAQMKPAIRAGSKAENRLCHSTAICMLFRMPATPTALDEEQLAKALRSLQRREPRFRAVVRQYGIPSLRATEAGLPSLLQMVTEQFLSLSAAAAIWNRITAHLDEVHAHTVLACPQAQLVELGLSRAKAKSFHGLAQAVSEGLLDFDTLSQMPDDDAHKMLVSLPGIGPWTADIYLLSVLQRPNAWPWGDVALQAAAQHLFELPGRPGKAEMLALGERFHPYRAVAARLLWSHYRGLKKMSQA
jgi:DNA-3-methyladenine glycosylase II